MRLSVRVQFDVHARFFEMAEFKSDPKPVPSAGKDGLLRCPCWPDSKDMDTKFRGFHWNADNTRWMYTCVKCGQLYYTTKDRMNAEMKGDPTWEPLT